MKIIKLLDRKILSVYVFFGILISFDNLVFPMITENVVKSVENSDINLLQNVAIFGLIGFALMRVVYYAYQRSDYLLTKDFNTKMKRIMYKQYHTNPIKSEKFQNILYRDLNTVKESYIDSIFNISRSVFLSAVPLIYMFSLNFRISIIYIIFAIIPLFISGMFDKKIAELGEIASTKNEEYIKDINENINATVIIKHYLRLPFFKNRHDEYLEEAESAGFNSKEILSRARLIAMTVYGISYILPLVYGAYIVINGDATLAALTGIYMTAERAILPISSIISDKNTIKSSIRVVEKVKNFIFAPMNEEVVENGDQIEIKDINFDDVEIGYDKTLFTISDRLRSNEKVLIKGGSGSGKSTLFKTLFRDIDPIDGTIYLNDSGINEYNKYSLYKNIGYIPQEVIIFDESVEFNITLGENYTKEEIYESLSKSGFSKYDFNDFLSRQAGAEGSNLSGGEKARICIARALIRGYKILLVDEFSASLDRKVAKEIRNILLKSDITVLEIAHHYDDDDLSLFDKTYDINNGVASILTNNL